MVKFVGNAQITWATKLPDRYQQKLAGNIIVKEEKILQKHYFATMNVAIIFLGLEVNIVQTRVEKEKIITTIK
jgi:hypothetical protein